MGSEVDGRSQTTGSPGSVLAPMVFNIYTKDQPQFPDILRFMTTYELYNATQSDREKKLRYVHPTLKITMHTRDLTFHKTIISWQITHTHCT